MNDTYDNLIHIDINKAEEISESFQDVEADRKADVCVIFNGKELEFSLSEFAALLGFKEQVANNRA